MKKILFSIILVTFVFSCNIENPVYSIVLSSDVYYENSYFKDEFNPLLKSASEEAFLLELVPTEEICIIQLIQEVSASQPRALLYSYSNSTSLEVEGLIFVFKGTTPTYYADFYNALLTYYGYLSSYVKTISNILTNHLDLIKNNNVYFVGHSLGAKIAHSMGFLFDMKSIGVDGPGMLEFGRQLETEYNSTRSYEKYHQTKTINIVGVPNLVNLSHTRAEKTSTVIFNAPINYCYNLNSFPLSQIPLLEQVARSFSWTQHYHGIDNMIATLIENKKNLNAVIEKIPFSLKKVFNHSKARNLLDKLINCLFDNSIDEFNLDLFRKSLIDELDELY